MANPDPTKTPTRQKFYKTLGPAVAEHYANERDRLVRLGTPDRQAMAAASIATDAKILAGGFEGVTCTQAELEQHPVFLVNTLPPRPGFATTVKVKREKEDSEIPIKTRDPQEILWWAFEHLDDKSVRAMDAPSPVAWSLLKQARKSDKLKQEFFSKNFGKLSGGGEKDSLGSGEVALEQVDKALRELAIKEGISQGE